MGRLIASVLEENEEVTELPFKYMPSIFHVLNKFIHNNYVNEYVERLISKDPKSIIYILDAYAPTAWDIESGISYKSDFERNQYDNLTSVLDPLIVLRAIQDNFPPALKKLDAFPRIYNDEAENGLILLEQFIWLHRYVLNESLKNDEHNGDENES